MINFDFICIDFQNDFVNEQGKNFITGDSVKFIQNYLFDYFTKNNIKVAEIVSDYRLPRGKSVNESCIPGTFGYISCLPEDLRKGKQWIKCMHNPLWIRKNIGVPHKKLGKEFQSPRKFNNWLKNNIYSKDVILFGETADCCLLQTASELYFRGYNVYFIYEATDPMNERLNIKEDLLKNSSINIYAKVICFDDLLKL